MLHLQIKTLPLCKGLDQITQSPLQPCDFLSLPPSFKRLELCMQFHPPCALIYYDRVLTLIWESLLGR